MTMNRPPMGRSVNPFALLVSLHRKAPIPIRMPFLCFYFMPACFRNGIGTGVGTAATETPRRSVHLTRYLLLFFVLGC